MTRGTVEDTRDGQKSRLYKWEDEVVQPYGGQEVTVTNAQAVVNHVWAEMGLKYPPRVQKYPPNRTRALAEADRELLRMQNSVPTWVILHELAHSMTHNIEGKGHGHNEIFVGVYMSLCVKFLGMDQLMLEHTATMMKVKFKSGARPIMLD